MSNNDFLINRTSESVLASNRVLRNTYLLLALSLLFSAACAGVAMVTNTGYVNILLFILGFYGLNYLVYALRNSPWGLVAIFAFTGFLGYTLGPILNFYLHFFSNGYQLVMTALGGTGIIFIGLSAYAVTTQKDFSYLAGFILTAVLVSIFGVIASLFFNAPILQIGLSALFILISSALILFQTSQIINGGETNYIVATITLYVSIYNLFLSLLRILAIFAGNRD